MDNLKRFETQAQYEAATLSYPNVSWIVSGDTVHYVKEKSTFSGLTVYYNVADISEPTQLFNGGSGGSGSGSGGGGGVLPSAMKIDGAEVEVTNSYQFSTTGEHIVQFSFEDNMIPNDYFSYLHVTKVEIGDAITSIGDSAFIICTSLSSVTIGNGVTSIGNDVFQVCQSLSSITIPNSVTYIGSSIFYNCSGLTSVTIGSGVTSIGDYVFGFCSNLTSITSNAMTAPTISNITFWEIGSNGTLYVPSGSSGYDTWMQNAENYLGLYNWTKVEQ